MIKIQEEKIDGQALLTTDIQNYPGFDMIGELTNDWKFPSFNSTGPLVPELLPNTLLFSILIPLRGY